MGYEITTSVTVGANGHVEADLPELWEGQTVELVVRTPHDAKRSRGGYGALAGEILYISDDFDAPLEEFAEYS